MRRHPVHILPVHILPVNILPHLLVEDCIDTGNADAPRVWQLPGWFRCYGRQLVQVQVPLQAQLCPASTPPACKTGQDHTYHISSWWCWTGSPTCAPVLDLVASFNIYRHELNEIQTVCSCSYLSPQLVLQDNNCNSENV